jgi:hypothetical protein
VVHGEYATCDEYLGNIENIWIEWMSAHHLLPTEILTVLSQRYERRDDDAVVRVKGNDITGSDDARMS